MQYLAVGCTLPLVGPALISGLLGSMRWAATVVKGAWLVMGIMDPLGACCTGPRGPLGALAGLLACCVTGAATVAPGAVSAARAASSPAAAAVVVSGSRVSVACAAEAGPAAAYPEAGVGMVRGLIGLKVAVVYWL